MRGWEFPTTADIGMRCFAASVDELLQSAVVTMQRILLSKVGSLAVNRLPRNSNIYELEFSAVEGLYEEALVRLLEETLFRSEVEDEWLVEINCELEESAETCRLRCKYEWVDSLQVEREVEIKAVTLHDLRFEQLGTGDSPDTRRIGVPQITGPGWYCDVIFDI